MRVGDIVLGSQARRAYPDFFLLSLSLPTSNLSANPISYTFKLFPELSAAHFLQCWFKPLASLSCLFFFFFLSDCWAALPSMWDLSCLTEDQTCVPCIGNVSLTSGLPGSPLSSDYCRSPLTCSHCSLFSPQQPEGHFPN